LLAPILQSFQGKALLALIRLAGLVGKPPEFVACLARRGDRCLEGNAASVALAKKIAAFRVDAAHAPEAFGGAGEPRGIEADRVGVVCVHMLDDAGLGGEEILRTLGPTRSSAGARST